MLLSIIEIAVEPAGRLGGDAGVDADVIVLRGGLFG
jgi:hypothetical protein